MLPKKLWEGIDNKTIKHQLSGTDSKVPLLTEQALADMDKILNGLSTDGTKTKAMKAKLMAQKLLTHIEVISKQMGTEVTSANDLHNELMGKVASEAKFVNSDQLHMAARWLDVIKTEDQFYSLISTQHDVARLALHDPVTRHKYGVTPEIEQAAVDTCVNHTLGPTGITTLKSTRAQADTLNDFAVMVGSISDDASKVLKAIETNEV